jgi:hypothetical protein
MATAQELFDEAFPPNSTRTPCSQAYRDGVLAVLRLHIDRVGVRQPYKVGSAEADAFFSGAEEGHRIARSRGLLLTPRGES